MSPKILDRYVIRETLAPFLMALAVFTFLFAVRPMMDNAQALLTKGVPVGTVIYLLANLLPQALGITLPMALLIGLLMALGRLSADRETVAFLACGISLWRLVRPALIMSAAVGLATLWVMIDGIPAGNKAFVQVTTNLIAERSAQEIKPGQFYEGFPGKVLRVESVTPDGRWQRVILAITRDQGAPTMVLANEGRLIINEKEGRAEIILTGTSRFMPGTQPGVYDRADDAGGEERYVIDPQEIFRKVQIVPGIREMTIAELKEEWNYKNRVGESPRNAIMFIHQKFSFPVACLVMGLLAVAFGVHTRKDGKFASFALGIAVIFVYYGLMNTFENLTKGDLFPAALARWVPNLLLGPLAILVIWWRSRDAERSVTLRLPPKIAARLATVGEVTDGAPAGKPVLVIRLPSFRIPRPRLLDLYLLRRYFSVVVLSFIGLLGLFYIGTVVDLSEKLFKGSASMLTLIDFLFYSTPQFIYFLMPIAVLVAALVTIGTLSKTGELTVIRSCGVSLYRLSAPLLVAAAVWSVVLFALEERVLAAANKKKAAIEDVIRERQSTIIDVTSRHWLAGTRGRVYYYRVYQQRQRVFTDLSVYELSESPYRVTRHTFVQRASLSKGAWSGGPGWTQSFPAKGPPVQDAFQARALALDSATYFETETRDAEAMTVTQLGEYVKTIKASGLSSGSFEVELHRKYAMPLMTLIMTLIAIPFGVTTGRRGALYGIGLAIALAFAYQITFTAFGFFGSAELLPAVLAAWAPNLLFLAGASYLLFTVRT
jgi:LPS export ABC transporter permease LptG/LPS export ABC transporter permease LptF